MVLMHRCRLATCTGLVLLALTNQSAHGQPTGKPEPELFLSPEQPVSSPAPTESQEPSDLQKPSESTSSGTSNVPNPLDPLNPNPDPLRVPSQASDITVDLTQPITLDQALELAQRNNLDLRVAELQLQQNQAGLRQAKAARWPTLAFQGDLSRTDSAAFALTPRPISVNIGAQNTVINRILQRFQQQQALSLQDLQQNIQNLQLRLRQGPEQQRQLAFDQQLQALQQRASITLPPSPSFTPLSPLSSFASSGQGSTDGVISNTLNAAISLTYNLFTSGSRSALIRTARAQVRLAELSLQSQLEQLRLDVTNDYYNLQEATALIEVAQASVENATQSVVDARALERAGLGTLFDVLQGEVQLADAQQNLTQAQTLEQVAQRQLAQRLNVPDTVTISSADPVAPSGQWPLSLPKSIRLALQNRPELAQLLQQRRIAKQQRRVALASVRPQVQAFANINFQDQFEDSVSGAFGYSLGAQLNWNFFDGGAAKALARQEDENIAIAETQFADTKNALRFQVEQAYSTLQSNFKSIETSANTVEQATESLRLARLRFQAGIGTQLDITTAQADLTQAQGNYLSAILDYNRALALIQRATSYRQPPTPP